MRVYLAGPIAGCDEDGAKGWRDLVSILLEPFGITPVSPLRCEPSIEGVYDLNNVQYGDPKFGSAEAIAAKNEFDVRSCDIMLAHFPNLPDRVQPSVGTIVEIGWAYILGKPVILVSRDPALRNHPLIKRCCGWQLDTLGDAVEVLQGVLDVYTEGGKR